MAEFFTGLPLILDGATGTQLQKYGMPAGVSTEKWVLENPDTIKKIQRAYVEAGSGAVFAPTFAANRVGLKKCGLENQVEDTVARLVDLTRQAVGGRALIAGDMSPTGLMLEPFGEATYEYLVEVFAEQARALCDAGVDFIGIETMMYLDEAKAAVEGIRSVTDKPITVSFTCGGTGRTIWGEMMTDVVSALEPMGISAFGINCCGDMDLVKTLLEELRGATDLPLIAKPNAGQPQIKDGKTAYLLSPEELGERVPGFVQAGASILGGCCGTDERHIAAIKETLAKL